MTTLMRRIALLLFAALAFNALDATACGDKFLLVGRGARYQRDYVAIHPGVILLYATTPLTSSRGLRAALKMAGHKVTVASTRAELDQALRAGKFDILLADGSESLHLSDELLSSTMIVPVLSSGTAVKKASSGKDFCVLKADRQRRNPIAILDEILGSKLKGTPAPCEQSL